jgi:lipopolysaccharide export system ATP-binding protein
VNQGESWGSLVLTEKQLHYMIVGLVKPNSEYISGRFEHHWLPDVQESTTGIGYLAQEASVFKIKHRRQHIKRTAIDKLSKAEQVAKMESLIEEFSLEHIRTNRGDLLSGGERRTSTRCLATDPNSYYWMNLLRVSIL